jgi:hypothetical protein
MHQEMSVDHHTPNTPYMISTPGGKMVTQYLAKNTLLNLAGKVYKTSPIILDGQGIDVILGMSWMKEFMVRVDIAARTMHLESLAHGSVVLQLPSPIVIVSALQHSRSEPRRHSCGLQVFKCHSRRFARHAFKLGYRVHH